MDRSMFNCRSAWFCENGKISSTLCGTTFSSAKHLWKSINLYYPEEGLLDRPKYWLSLYISLCIFGFSFVVWRWFLFTLLWKSILTYRHDEFPTTTMTSHVVNTAQRVLQYYASFSIMRQFQQSILFWLLLKDQVWFRCCSNLAHVMSSAYWGFISK